MKILHRLEILLILYSIWIRMRLKSLHVTNFRSIIDSNVVDVHPEITNIVGMTSSGKTSFLEMTSAVDDTITFDESELPNGSRTKQDFQDGHIEPNDILQLVAEYEVEESDREFLPEKYRATNKITYKRFFGGRTEIIPEEIDVEQINLDDEISQIKEITDNLKIIFQAGVARGVGNLAPHKEGFDNSVDDFLGTKFSNLSELDLSIESLRSTVDSTPADQPLRNEFNARINELVNVRTNIQQKIEDDPIQQVYDLLPKPIYKDTVFELEDEISIDEFVADVTKSQTFHSIAVVTGLTPSGLQKIRTAGIAEQDSYLDAKSKTLSKRLNDYWTQDDFDFKLRLNNGILSFVVKDNTTGIETSVLDRSEGFKWWVAFFLEISTLLAKKSGRSIILLDNPATELHDEGKEDVLKFITNATKSDKLQIIYSTHERALIDPWRTDRIRVVELTKNGTKIENVKSKSRHDLLNVIRKNIGSPARYSLFGAPRTLAFEGVSDTYIVSAVNEYLAQQGDSYLHKDSYSINAINGIDKAPEFCKFYKEIGLDFVIVVDSGSETLTMKGNLEDDDFEKHFVEINEITEKDSDTEDLVDPKLYYLAFASAYEHILDSVPSQDEIDSDSNKKRITNYDRWFESKELSFNKTIVAQQMFKIIMDESTQKNEKEAIANTIKNFLKLFKLINKKYP